MAETPPSSYHYGIIRGPTETSPTLHFLSSERNLDNRPIWGPPILNYGHLMDTKTSQSYTKLREAVLEYTGGDVVRTTGITDEDTESELLEDYIEWAEANIESIQDEKAKTFFVAVRDDLVWD